MKNHITKNDLRSFFAVNHQPVIEKECNFLVFNYSSEESGFMTFEDFLKMFTPKTNKELIQKLQDQYQAYAQGTMILPQQEINQASIPFFIEDISVKLLNLELKFFRELEAQKMYFTNKYGTNILSAFQNISERGHSFDMYRCGYTFTIDNFHFLMNRIDKDGNGLISKDEFLDEKFILPSYKFATYSSMMSTQKINNPIYSPYQQQDYRTVTSGTFRIADSSDQKGQFSFIQRSLQREDGKPLPNGYYQVPLQKGDQPYLIDNNQNGIYQGLNQGRNNLETEVQNQQQVVQNEFIQQRMLNYQKQQQELQLQQQQQQQQQQVSLEKISSHSQKNQLQDSQSRQKQQNINLQQQNSQHQYFSDSQNFASYQNQVNESSSPNHFAINDSINHANQIYVNSHSQSNLALLSQKKI